MSHTHSSDVRSQLTDALRLDLVGPGGNLGDPAEVLPQAPARWYLTGFLVPLEANDNQKEDVEANDELDELPRSNGADEATAPESTPARQRRFPSSIGLSVLVRGETRHLHVTVRWGDYTSRKPADGHGTGAEWVRTPREETLSVALPAAGDRSPQKTAIPHSRGLELVVSVRDVDTAGTNLDLPPGSRSLSVFLVNRRQPAPDEKQDEGSVFQAELELRADESFLSRPNLRSLASDDWDERVADLQYRNDCEYAVGHSVATAAEVVAGACHTVRTCWIPLANVERVAPAEIANVELSMTRLAALPDAAAAIACLAPLVTQYRAWIETQRAQIPASPERRRETAEQLLQQAQVASRRIEQGIELLRDPVCFEAFRLANRAMATAAQRRLGVMQGRKETDVRPTWRPFQLAFLLMNLPGIAEPTSHDREVVDLLFFPTGGGKTEAYLGLAAFTLVLRRLRHPGIDSAGVSVLMRYTLRLLTLDQLGRAATLICALELLRQSNVPQLGDWPFEIGLWVGKAATPNVMGRKGDNNSESARAKTLAYQQFPKSKPSPIPLEDCPWCGEKFDRNSFRLVPRPDEPTDLRVGCVNHDCAFSRDNPLPILAVDEPIYRRLPCFLIATVDKFAALPWTGPVGAFFGRVQRHDPQGFYGPCDGPRGRALPHDRLPPPDLIIQDELHLISGPLGTIAGLYETALDELATTEIGGKRVRPKIIASTATVRRAESQIRALFNHRFVDIFPPPGPDRHHSFFARTLTIHESHARQYVAVAAQGRSPKAVMLRVYLVLLATAARCSAQHPPGSTTPDPADPYLTLLGYFNSLRELGGSRRLIEDEVRSRLAGYASRKRVGETQGLFENRQIAYEPVELTSRVSTAKVAEAKRLLSLPFDQTGRVDVAIATNMISVGLDITRLGLMVVFGQPKTSAEYIQATSRVGRDPQRPGLVVTILNIHKPRDRSHYERFAAYHESFYRSIEATSVTPFSPRALDRALAGTLVALARQGHLPMTAARGALEILQERTRLEFVVTTLAERAFAHNKDLPEDEKERLRQRVRDRARDLLDEWSKLAQQLHQTGAGLQYQAEVGQAPPLLHEFLSPEVKNLPPHHPRMKFRANRSMRDVEPSVNLWLRTLDGLILENEET